MSRVDFVQVEWVFISLVQFLKLCKYIQLSSKICKSIIKFENLHFEIDLAICVGFIFCLLQLCHLKLTSF